MEEERVRKVNSSQDLRRTTEQARRKVAKWPRWKRALKLTKYSTGFIILGNL